MGVVAVDGHPGDGACLRVVVDVVHAGHPGHQALDGVVRAGHASEQFGHGQADGHQHPVEDVDGEDADQAAEGQRRRQPAEAREVDHADGRVDQECAQDGRGGVVEQSGEKEQDGSPAARSAE